MRVKDGYKRKVKFSVTFEDSLFHALDRYCRDVGCHRTALIEKAVRKWMEDSDIDPTILVDLPARDLKPRRSTATASASKSVKPRPHKRRRSVRVA